MDARRVVTGHNADGKAVFVSDEKVEPVTLALLPGSEFHQLWGSDEAPTFPDDGSRPAAPRYFPRVGGMRFGFFTVPPDGGQGVPPDLDLAAALAEFDAKLPGMTEYLEVEEPGMHTTATIDFGVVLSGRATLELDDGAKVVLETGDTYVQNGTRHRWSNTGAVPAVLAVALIGAYHRDIDSGS
jgi:mannose-6-phosphate isomerase-like protein (cupin superfamily)